MVSKNLSQDDLKLAAANVAIDFILNFYKQNPNYFENAFIGIGTGTTANFFIDLISQNDKYKQQFQTIFKAAICSSNASEQRLVKNNFPIISLNEINKNIKNINNNNNFHEKNLNLKNFFIPFYIDGADEINKHLQMIKGGGGALTREKIVASMSQQFLCLADETKYVQNLGKFPLAIEILPSAKYLVMQKLNTINQISNLKNIKIKTINERQNFITDNQNLILDIQLENTFTNEQAIILENALNSIVGVVENGLFTQNSKLADILFLATQNGVETIK